MKKIKKYLFTLLVIMSIFIFKINYVNAKSDAGKISLTKSAVKEDITYGRSATITLGISANAFTTVDKTDVVLVLDRSTSMNGNSMISTKSAARDLINLLITDKSSDKVRVGIVTYGTNLLGSYTSKSLTNNKVALINLINSIPVNLNNQGTNIHAGLIGANNLLASSESGTQKIVILLSDGAPTFYIGTNNNICGNGQFDYIDLSKDCNVSGNRKPSTVANREAKIMKDSNITIYTIGFNMSTSSDEYAFLGNIATSTSNRYQANNYDTLRKTFKNIVNDFTTVATDSKVVDIVPVGFQIKEGTLPSYAKAVVNSDGTTTITWDVGNIKSTEENSLSYTVEAKEDHYGSMYTNVSAVLTATTLDKNPYYEETKLEIYFEKPTVPIPGITNDDNYYDIKQGTTFNALETSGILKNDKLDIEHLDDSAIVSNKIVLVTDEATTGNINDININPSTGAFTYKTSSSSLGQITYKYYVETMVILNGESTIVKSNTSTITLNVIKNPTTYVVNYLEKGTNKILHEKKNGEGYVYDVIKENAIEINGYNKVNPESETITLDISNNIINFYYTKRKNLSYKVNYLEKETNKILHEQKKYNNQTYGSVITSNNEIIEIDGYNYDSVDKEKLTITTGENVINIFYTKRTDLGYKVNYLEKGTNKILHEQKVYDNETFGNVITSNNEIIEIDGYNYDSVDKEKLTITTGENVINIYYTKRTNLSYKVNYLEKGTNKILHEQKIYNNQTYGNVITSKNEIIDIDGYNYDSVDKEKLTITTRENVINIYYTKRTNLSYKVNYLEKGTNKVLHEQKVYDNETFGNVIISKNEIIDIDGYNYDSVDKEKLTITTGENEINIYYTKRTNLGYTVNYLEKGTNKILHEQKVYNNQTYGSVITSKNEIIEIDGYNYDSVDKEKLTITTGENEINIYYKASIGIVKAIYVDTGGKEISDSIITEGKVSTEYKTNSKEIYKYRLLRVEGSEKGLYGEDEIIVTYVYEMIPMTGVSASNISILIPILSLLLFIFLIILRKKIFN